MERLTKLIAEILRISEKEITDDLSINNTDTWDSLKHMELIVVIEETFKIKLTTEEIVIMVNMKAIKQILKNKGVNIKNGD